MDIVIATNNQHKLNEYKDMLSPLGFNCLSLKELNIIDDAEETGKTFAENSLIKAESVARYTNKIILADDSGLIIDAMENELGVYSKRFTENSSYVEKMQEIIKRLENNVRSARFVCVITLLNYKDSPIQFEGICEGSISKQMKGSNGFGYNPIFVVDGFNKTMAEMEEVEKNAVSHRGLACKKLVTFLKESEGK